MNLGSGEQTKLGMYRADGLERGVFANAQSVFVIQGGETGPELYSWAR